MSYKIALCSLGCAKNLVDSERILGILKNRGYCLTNDFSEADIIIVNTCGFIEAAKKESIDAIIEYSAYKKNHCRFLVVTGCLVQKYKNELRTEIPEVDLWLGTLDFESIGEKLDHMLPNTEKPAVKEMALARQLSTPSHWAYVKIAEGCDNTCTFCVIPQMRGPYRSRSIEDIVKEVKILISLGVKEIILLAQDTTVYGKDIYGRPALKDLLRVLSQEDLKRIRLMYSYPQRIDRELLELMASEEKICSYLDIPMQHSEDKILKAMGRPERKEKLKNLLALIREIDHDFVVRTTFIVGFPGETQEDFDNLCDFVEEAKMDWVGVFSYSREDDTIAAGLPDQIDEEVKENRREYLMALLSRCSAQVLEKWLGRTLPVIIEGKTESNGEYSYYGRTSFQGPEVDGLTYVKSDKKDLNPGDEINVTIVATDVYDLMGEEI